VRLLSANSEGAGTGRADQGISPSSLNRTTPPMRYAWTWGRAHGERGRGGGEAVVGRESGWGLGGTTKGGHEMDAEDASIVVRRA
jgi:hypothetical protein